jgi:hypothetical protein
MVALLEYVRPELFDEVVDRHHHSYVSAVLDGPLGMIRCRMTCTLLPIHPRCIPKYVIHIYYLFLFFTIVIALSKLIFFQATCCRTSPCCAVGRGGQATSWGSASGAVDAVQLRRPIDRRVHGPVATRDAHVPLPRWRDDSGSGGRRDVGRTAVCWAGDGADRHPETWQADFLARFVNVLRNDRASTPYVPFVDPHGPTLTWV